MDSDSDDDVRRAGTTQVEIRQCRTPDETMGTAPADDQVCGMQCPSCEDRRIPFGVCGKEPDHQGPHECRFCGNRSDGTENPQVVSAPGLPLVYEGDPITLSQGEGAWVPVVALGESAFWAEHGPLGGNTQVVLPSKGTQVEVVPGIWESESECVGMVCVVSTDEFDTMLEPGTQVGEVHRACIQTRVCQVCGGQDTDAWGARG